MGDRVNRRDEFMGLLADIFKAHPRDHWVETLRKAGVPCGPVRSLEEALNAPEVIEAGLIQTLDHPTAGELRTLRSPIGLPGSPDRQDLPPPLLGEHTDEILKNVLGLNDSEVAGLRSDEVVA